MTDHQNAINPGARSSVGISLAPGPSSTAYDDQLIERRDYFEVVAGRISRNRDMWRGQCERQAAEIERLREALNLALEYWADRQQRYKNRAPAWVEKARAALQSQDREDAFCVWHNDPETDNSWDTSCRQLFEIYDGTPAENRMKFCCYCGKQIREAIGRARRIEGGEE